MELERPGVVFQEDSAPSHTARLAKTWFTNNEVALFPHPPNSPDLNPIKPVWHELNKLIRAWPHLPSSIPQLISTIHDAWTRYHRRTLTSTSGPCPKECRLSWRQRVVIHNFNWVLHFILSWVLIYDSVISCDWTHSPKGSGVWCLCASRGHEGGDLQIDWWQNYYRRVSWWVFVVGDWSHLKVYEAISLLCMPWMQQHIPLRRRKLQPSSVCEPARRLRQI